MEQRKMKRVFGLAMVGFGMASMASQAFAGGTGGALSFISTQFEPIVEFIQGSVAFWGAAVGIVVAGLSLAAFRGQGGSGVMKAIGLALLGGAVAVNSDSIVSAIGGSAALIP